MFVTHPDYIREKARQMRIEKDMTIDEIAERLAISRQTIYHWVRDIPLRRARLHGTPAQRFRNEANSRRYQRLRDAAYEEGREQYDTLAEERTFTDFVCMYIGEGSKRRRNEVEICNSDPKVIALANYWIKRLAGRPVSYAVHYHADQDPDELRRFWAQVVDADPAAIVLQRKSNSNQLKKRTWRSEWGVLAIRTNDTYFRARLQAWIDRTVERWLDFSPHGV